MKLGLIDIDGHNFPNLALMKLSAYHKGMGDEVGWYNPWEHYDLVYQSKVFTFSNDYLLHLNADEVIKGGSGYDLRSQLPEEAEYICPDYSIYPMYDSAYGFITRGCPNKCSFCVVPEKEGGIKAYMDIEEFLSGRKTAILLDNNVLAHKHGIRQIEKIVSLDIKVDFNQGLDARLIDNSVAKLLSLVKWLKPIRMACDNKNQIKHIERAVNLLRKYNTTPQRYFVYMLVTDDLDDAYERAMKLRSLNLDPFAQPFVSRDNKPISKKQRNFARWVNHKAIFKSVDYKDYK